MQLLKNGLIYNGVGYPQDLSAFSKKMADTTIGYIGKHLIDNIRRCINIL